MCFSIALTVGHLEGPGVVHLMAVGADVDRQLGVTLDAVRGATAGDAGARNTTTTTAVAAAAVGNKDSRSGRR